MPDPAKPAALTLGGVPDAQPGPEGLPPPPAPAQAPRPRAPRGVADADRPSETAGQPGVGEGASAQSFARDLVGHQAGEDEEGGEPGGTSADRERGA